LDPQAADSPDSWFETLSLPSRLLEPVLKMLKAVGITPAPWLLQAFVLLVAVLAILVLVRGLAATTDVFSRLWRVGVIAGFGLMAAGVVASWTDEALNPQRPPLLGKITGAPLDDATVVLFARVREGPLTTGDIDKSTGEFTVYYEPVFGDPPTAVVVRASACTEQRVAVGRQNVRAGTRVLVDMQCP
jgi:hypothetical protein